ncbi:MAG TPA: alpha-hydroxyketone-type quorum-sensing autoinducer synthase [Paraburkholderia sp.]|uniref:alpha-hydroxyketone-type quorum-sensing autoinducer synthase n=1 Tax=Paraburkholderia sp. TaxID=1926495 RepID=UPI002BCCA24D|nr:alpha-hydroxyketone-type quorum-sensing autoinducer synthase [Paraburkholderia sp.]HTR06223.1 alpha-hydroxyketone-type quorum-sensing autoinducer synthase [Paraburkholderia sp.]
MKIGSNWRSAQNNDAALPAFLAARVDRYYTERVQDSWAGGHIMKGRVADIDALHLSSNDYLSIARHPEILDAMCMSIRSEGNGLLMSGVFLHGDDCPQLVLEDRFAAYMGAEASVLCQSGFAANTGLIQSIASAQTPVYVDMMAHMSLWEGIRSAGARAISFFHNDVDHLEQRIQRYGAGIVIVDSVYSTNGSVAPLAAIADVCTEHGCVLVVDESHSLGTHGPHGAGLVAELGLIDRVHFRTASLAKAFAGRAGIISCSRRFQEYFKCEALPAIFSSTLLPHETAALAATLDVIEREDWRRTRVAANARYVRARLAELGYNLNGSETQIIALEAGPEPQTIVLRDALEARGVFGSVFCAPATAQNRSLVRLSINAALSAQELERIVDVCEEIRDEVQMWNWPSTRRNERNAGRGRVRAPQAVVNMPMVAVAA